MHKHTPNVYGTAFRNVVYLKSGLQFVVKESSKLLLD